MQYFRAVKLKTFIHAGGEFQLTRECVSTVHQWGLWSLILSSLCFSRRLRQLDRVCWGKSTTWLMRYASPACLSLALSFSLIFMRRQVFIDRPRFPPRFPRNFLMIFFPHSSDKPVKFLAVCLLVDRRPRRNRPVGLFPFPSMVIVA